MAALLLVVIPAVLFTLVGRAASPARHTSAAQALRGTGGDFMRGLRVCAMHSPQFVTASTR